MRTIDGILFIEYLKGKERHKDFLADFFYKRFRPEAKRATDAWLATNPFQNPRFKSVDFSDPVYNNVSELIVTCHESPAIAMLDDLTGKEIYVRQSSSYFESLQRLNESFRKSGKTETRFGFYY